MTLYEINKQIEALIDPETGEIAEGNAFDQLEMMRDEKLENIALWIKDLSAEEDAIAKEISNLKERKEKAAKKQESLKTLLLRELNGQKFSTPRCAISFRRSQKVEVDEEQFLKWALEEDYGDEYLRFKLPEIDKQLLKERLKDGVEIPYARLTENTSVQIK